MRHGLRRAGSGRGGSGRAGDGLGRSFLGLSMTIKIIVLPRERRILQQRLAVVELGAVIGAANVQDISFKCIPISIGRQNRTKSMASGKKSTSLPETLVEIVAVSRSRNTTESEHIVLHHGRLESLQIALVNLACCPGLQGGLLRVLGGVIGEVKRILKAHAELRPCDPIGHKPVSHALIMFLV